MYSSEYYLLPVSVNRISVRVRGGEAQDPTAGLDGMNLGLIRDLGAAFFESHCELNDKTSSPFSSNRTMFETEEVRRHTEEITHLILSAMSLRVQTSLISSSSLLRPCFRW